MCNGVTPEERNTWAKLITDVVAGLGPETQAGITIFEAFPDADLVAQRKLQETAAHLFRTGIIGYLAEGSLMYQLTDV